ncbi:MAG: murein biosynthesis integral membrane protein MurJ [Ktedonobacteraceae bacterium]|nr:murein biosynthesis integral membrane protein MurJ [Ktedonobacteraceae bacterium]
MANEGQKPPSTGQEAPAQQGFYGWQYDQEEEDQGQPPVVPPVWSYVPQQPPSQPVPPPVPVQPPVNPAPIPPPGGRQPQLRPQYKEPIRDMGTSLGYGQGMEYQYFDTPQPSQPIAQLRQERLQQLREERMRRQQRRMVGPDITALLPWGAKRAGHPPTNGVADLSSAPLLRPGWQAENPPPPQLSSYQGEVGIPEAAFEAQPYAEIPAPENLQSAAAPAQDTSMLQRVRIGRATAVLTTAFVASRFLGLLRTAMFAFVFGTSHTSDAYLQAFLIPDLIFNIVAGGALSSAFIPVFTNYMVGDKDEKTAWHIASSALNLAIAVMMVLAFLAIIFARLLVPIYNPGVGPAQLDLIASLTRIMLLQSIALGAGVIVTAVLNARQNFRLPAIGTVVYNVGLILGLIPGLYLAFRGQRNDTLAVYAATWGVVLGALFQIGVQIPGLRRVGMQYNYKSFDWRHPGVIQIGRQMVPRIVNAAMLYLSTFVDRGLIQLLVVVAIGGIGGLITQYYQALQLMLLPLGIFGMAVSTAAFPTLAENVAKGRIDRVRNTIMETLRSILFMSIPSSVGLIVLGFPIIQVLLQHGRFGLRDAESTAVPLAFFAMGLAGLASVEILTRSFYALRDSKTPVIVSVGQFIFKIALSLVIIDVAVWGTQWGMGALAFSTSLAGLLEAIVLYWLLHLRVGLPLKEIGVFIARVMLASLAMGLALLVLRVVLDHIPFLNTTLVPTLGLLGTIAAILKLLLELFVGVFVYVRASRLLGIEELGPVRRVLDRLKLSWI